MRNLTTIQTQLRADYIIVGQVQKDPTGVRVLAHLLKMPGQTHVRVHRLDTPALINPLAAESEFARNATTRFLNALNTASPATAKR